jgi:hypothetical protein
MFVSKQFTRRSVTGVVVRLRRNGFEERFNGNNKQLTAAFVVISARRKTPGSNYD